MLVCIFWNELLTDWGDVDEWIQCAIYQQWAYEQHSNNQKEDDAYICDFYNIVRTNTLVDWIIDFSGFIHLIQILKCNYIN